MNTEFRRTGRTYIQLSRALVVPGLGRARRSFTGAPPSLVLRDEQPFRECSSEIYEKGNRLATAYHACNGVACRLSRAFHRELKRRCLQRCSNLSSLLNWVKLKLLQAFFA